MGKTLTELMQENFETHKAKGWVDGRSVPEDIALIHSELSEALEDHRAGKGSNEVWYEEKVPVTVNGEPLMFDDVDGLVPVVLVRRHYGFVSGLKPCGIPSEMADIIIRVMNFCSVHGIDLEKAVEEKMAFNATRPHRHGGKAL